MEVTSRGFFIGLVNCQRAKPFFAPGDFHTAVLQAIEEAELNGLVANADMVGRDGKSYPCPAKVVVALKSRGVIAG